MLLNFTQLDTNKKGSLYHTIYNELKTAIDNNIIKKGEKLPSVREAAAQLGVSRTTVENAYERLCIEGIAESQPQKGYFVIGTQKSAIKNTNAEKNTNTKILYDFSSRSIDTAASDTDLWKRLVRSVLLNSEELTSYGDQQGEIGLREALASYTYKARGVNTVAENIIIGAGIGPLLNILCGLLGRNVKVGIENGGFNEAQSIFSDYGIENVLLPFDANGATLEGISKNNIDVLFLLPSALSKISTTALSKRRNEYVGWVNSKPNRIIIEDDYNGELRYNARTVPAFQNKAVENTVYIGSFSKLLLPSVRIAYMVLPHSLAEKFQKRKNSYNQTCGKIEQLALEKYILSGALEKQLRRLRRLYYTKSQILCNELKSKISSFKKCTLYESSLTVELETRLKLDSPPICEFAQKNGIRLIPSRKNGAVKLSFAGITQQDIPPAVAGLEEIMKKLSLKKQ